MATGSPLVAAGRGANGVVRRRGMLAFTTNSPASQTILQRVAGGGGTHVLRLYDQTGGRIDGVLRASADSSATSATLVTLSAQGFLITGVSGNAATGGVSPLAGVVGTANGGTLTARPTRTGVVGLSQNDTTGVGVYAEGVAYGVQGSATTLGLGSGAGLGVLGQSQSGNSVYGASNTNVGVLGTSTASHALFGSSINGYGLYATSTNSAGIVASANSGVGCQGTSNGNVGLLGTFNTSIGVFGSSTSGTGVYGTGPTTGYAARFDGPVQVNGAFTVVGGPKSAAVPHPDGTHRRLYCVESPESWFEDFGRDQLTNGRARVRLDPDFAALVHGNNYHVFLTDDGDSNGLYVADRNANGFAVREKKSGTSSLAFSYRVVAKRKDIAGPRLERVNLPASPQRPAAPAPPPAIPPLPAVATGR